MSQKSRTTLPFSGRQGSSASVPGSGCRSISERTSPPKPGIAEASIAMPERKARSSSEAMTEMFFCRPYTSQKARRTNFTFSSRAYCIISSAVYFISLPTFLPFQNQKPRAIIRHFSLDTNELPRSCGNFTTLQPVCQRGFLTIVLIFAVDLLTNCTIELIVFALYGKGAAGSITCGAPVFLFF